MTIRVGEVRVHPAPEHERQRGLLAWASAEVSGIVLDGLTVRVDQAGNVYVGFPKRQDAEGRLHPWFWPTDPRDRQDLEAQILAQIDLEGLTG